MNQMSFSRQKPVDAYWNMQEHQGGTGGKPIEMNWDTALQRYFPSVWHNFELIHVFIFSTLLTAPFWFSTVCYRVLRTIEIIHDPIHLGEKTPGLWWSQFVFGVTAQGYRMLVTWHVFNEATAVVKKSLWHLCKSQWRGGSLLTTCSDELPIKDVASLAVGKSTTALMFRVLFMPYICSTVDACSLGFGWSLVDICHCSSCSSPNNGMTRGWWPSDQPNWGGQRGVHGGDPGGAQTSQARHELAWTAYSSRKQDIDL